MGVWEQGIFTMEAVFRH